MTRRSFLEARVLARAERWNDAAEKYRLLVTVSPKGVHAARGAFEALDIEIRHGDPAVRWAQMDAF